MKATQITSAIAAHGEGPVWSPLWGGLRLLDMLAGDVLSLDLESGSIERFHAGTVAATVRPREHGGMVIATEREFLLVDSSGVRSSTPSVFSNPLLRFNEGTTTPDGSLLCGTMAYDESPGAGALYRFEPDGRVVKLFSGTTISNGIAFSQNGENAFYIDSPTHRIDIFDYKDGLLCNRREWARIPSDQGMPDGLCLDADGGVWVAMFGGGAVRRFDSEGAPSLVIEVPVTQVTACTFGGPKLDVLYITTSNHGLSAASDPRAGSIFAANPGIEGLPSLTFNG
jgi:sugar lactone lactonase YvrE